MSNFVFVLDTNNQPLNPVPPGQARRLLKTKQAAVYRRYPFTIILKYAVASPDTEPRQLKGETDRCVHLTNMASPLVIEHAARLSLVFRLATWFEQFSQ